MLFYARVARPYSGACLILLIQLYAWIGLGQAAPERKKAWVWFLLAAGALGVAWNHMLALFWGVLLLAWALFPVRALYPRATLYVLIASFLGHASLWVLTMVQPYDPIAWVKDKGRANAFNELAGYFVGEWETGTRSFPPMVLGVLLFAVFLGTLFWLLRQLGRRHISCNNATSCSLLVLGFLAVLPCLGVTLTHFLIKPVLQVRYILMFLPPLFLVFAVYLNGVRWGKFAAGFICLVAVCCGFVDLRETERHQYGTRRSVERIKELYEADSDALLVSNHMVAETARLFKVKKIELILPASDRYDPAVQVSDVPTAFNRIKRLWIIQVKDLPPMPPRSEIPSALGAVLVEEQIGLCKISCREVIPPPEPK